MKFWAVLLALILVSSSVFAVSYADVIKEANVFYKEKDAFMKKVEIDTPYLKIKLLDYASKDNYSVLIRHIDYPAKITAKTADIAIIKVPSSKTYFKALFDLVDPNTIPKINLCINKPKTNNCYKALLFQGLGWPAHFEYAMPVQINTNNSDLPNEFLILAANASIAEHEKYLNNIAFGDVAINNNADCTTHPKDKGTICFKDFKEDSSIVAADIDDALAVAESVTYVADGKAYVYSYTISFNTVYSFSDCALDYCVNSQNLEMSTYDYQSVLVHELGHVLGLAHSSGQNCNDQTMSDNGIVANSTSERTLKAGDIWGIYKLFCSYNPSCTCISGQYCSTPYMECISTCLKNSDCGIDGFEGNKFCNNGNVWQLYATNKCNNPGKDDAYCSATVTSKLYSDCVPSGCTKGYCDKIQCYKDSDCPKKPSASKLVYWYCQNPGEKDARCISKPAKIKTNAQANKPI